jgi:hypothetical protein
MLHAVPDALEAAWNQWLGTLHQPVVLVFAAQWGAPDHALLEDIRAELRALCAALVVATASRSFCFRSDRDCDEQLPDQFTTKRGLFALHRRYGLPFGEPAFLTLTLLDESGFARMQTSTDAVEEVPTAVLATLRSAGLSAAAVDRVLLSRREVALSSLMTAFALPFADAGKLGGKVAAATVTTAHAPSHASPSSACSCSTSTIRT